MDRKGIIKNCRILLDAYHNGKLWYMKMPEDEHPDFWDRELRFVYFTLPMALNYQRNSYTLRESAKKAYEDNLTKDIFDIYKVSNMEENELRKKLLQYKVALQPNKHINTRRTIAITIVNNWWSIDKLFISSHYDFLELRENIQKKYKSGFPYLSWPKIFNYRSFIIQSYGGIVLKNSEYIDIAPDTHVTQWSVKLWVITDKEANNLSKEEISNRRRTLLKWSGINPIDMHSPLRFRSRNNFTFKI